MTNEWKPGDRVQLTGTVLVACSKEYMKIKLDGSKVDNYVETSALAAGKRLPREFIVGDEVTWAQWGHGPEKVVRISSIDGDLAVLRPTDASASAISYLNELHAWLAPISELRPVPVKP